jgi:hypothetical protein
LAARATDNSGATNVFGPITVTVVTNPLAISSAGPITFNQQNGLWQQTDIITNRSASIITVSALLFLNINPASATIYNATGKTNIYNPPGDSANHFYILFTQPIQPYSTTNILVQYYTTGHVAPTSSVVALFLQSIPPGPATPTNLTQVHIGRGKFLPDGSYLLDFLTKTNRQYFVFYATNIVSGATVENPFTSSNWFVAPKPGPDGRGISGNGGPVQWIDYGPPLTPTLPTNAPYRYYRAFEKP